ncbi:hypothetical protein [Halostella sp. PRR32]|uniref:hypothetical protein n=1 Tax=Halostella sp. PRR32 TaxID=3098147 RepID=UPI002B1DA7C3|nr:hypothetical protein [Halostella sp. PRR32]
MARHRNRQRATHTLAATREEQVDEGDHGDPIYDTVDIVEGEPVQFDSGGTSFVRGDTGERVERTPTVEGRGALADLLQEGDDVTLRPAAPGASTLSGLEVVSIDADYGRRARAGSATIELEGV